MAALPLLALGAGIAGGLGRLFGSDAEADQREREARERARRQRISNLQTLGKAEAAGYASGITPDSASLQLYLSTMAEEMRKESDWAIKTEMQSASDVRTAGVFGAVTDIGSSVFKFGESNNWWR